MRGCFLPTLSDIVALGEFSQEGAGLGKSPSPPLTEEAEPDQWADRGQKRQQTSPIRHRLRTEREWQGAIAALGHLLRRPLPTNSHRNATADLSSQGVVLSGPIPVLDNPDLADRFSAWVFTPQSPDTLIPFTPQLLPAEAAPATPKNSPTLTLPLIPGDPLAEERFCLVLTSTFSLVLVLGEDATGKPRFQFSFTPEVIHQVWQLLRSRVMLAYPQQLDTIEQRVRQFAPSEPDYRLVANFGRLLLSYLPESRPVESSRVDFIARDRGFAASPPQDQVTFLAYKTHLGKTTTPQSKSDQFSPKPPQPSQSVSDVAAATAGPAAAASEDAKPAGSPSLDAQLLHAMAHEIRTPLTTIRTFTRSLLKRRNLSADVRKRLQLIDHECTQQIDRFNLIFRAVELETTTTKTLKSPLTPISLAQIFEESIPQWQQQAGRRNLTLDVILPPNLPMVASDPTLLNQVLTGLVERFTYSLTPYSHIQLRVMLAGHQLKLQFLSQPQINDPAKQTHCTDTTNQSSTASRSAFKSLGQLLIFQPETGGLSLNLNATKNLFQALGGKLIVRRRPQQGEVFTVFLPLERN
ncbi:MAG: HAMP domain-containing histidine kinase [Pseudanabaenales cyanobacterium]|nr:HAMP domain-containing histidine kinase [Pseudanabaenales cyanobacterium]